MKKLGQILVLVFTLAFGYGLGQHTQDLFATDYPGGGAGGGTHPVNLASDVTGTLPIANGGIGLTSLADSTLIVGDGSGDPVGESGATLRTSIGVGTGDSPTFGGQTLTSASGPQSNINSTASGIVGAYQVYYHNSASPVANDIIALFEASANDSGATKRLPIQIAYRFDDPTSTSMDSSIDFCVQNAKNAGSCNTIARLNSIGEWTNASGQAMKRYDARSNSVIFGSSILEKIAALQVGKWTHPNNPIDAPTNLYGYGPTAEGFYDAFNLGEDPRKPVLDTDGDGVMDRTMPGIGTGTISGILMAAVQELIKENDKLKERLNALEVQ